MRCFFALKRVLSDPHAVQGASYMRVGWFQGVGGSTRWDVCSCDGQWLTVGWGVACQAEVYCTASYCVPVESRP